MYLCINYPFFYEAAMPWTRLAARRREHRACMLRNVSCATTRQLKDEVRRSDLRFSL